MLCYVFVVFAWVLFVLFVVVICVVSIVNANILNRLGENIKHIKQDNELKQTSFEKQTRTTLQKYRISSPRTTIIYLFAEVRWLDILYFCCLNVIIEAVLFCLCLFLCVVCFRLVYLSFCIYNRTNTYKHIQTNKQTTTRRQQQKHNKHRNTLFPQPERERYLFAVGSWAGYTVCLFRFCCFVSKPFSVIYVFVCFVCFSLVDLSFCLNTIQYTTLNTNKLEMGLFMTCVNCSK